MKSNNGKLTCNNSSYAQIYIYVRAATDSLIIFYIFIFVKIIIKNQLFRWSLWYYFIILRFVDMMINNPSMTSPISSFLYFQTMLIFFIFVSYLFIFHYLRIFNRSDADFIFLSILIWWRYDIYYLIDDNNKSNEIKSEAMSILPSFNEQKGKISDEFIR